MQISKEDVFIKKKLSEEDAQFQKKLQRRNRIKELQKFEESLNTHKFKQDIDYNDPSQNFKGAKVPAHEKFSDLPDLEKVFLEIFLGMFGYIIMVFFVFDSSKHFKINTMTLWILILLGIYTRKGNNKDDLLKNNFTFFHFLIRSMKGVSSYIRGILEGHDKNSIQSIVMNKDI